MPNGYFAGVDGAKFWANGEDAMLLKNKELMKNPRIESVPPADHRRKRCVSTRFLRPGIGSVSLPGSLVRPLLAGATGLSA